MTKSKPNLNFCTIYTRKNNHLFQAVGHMSQRVPACSLRLPMKKQPPDPHISPVQNGKGLFQTYHQHTLLILWRGSYSRRSTMPPRHHPSPPPCYSRRKDCRQTPANYNMAVYWLPKRLVNTTRISLDLPDGWQRNR